jgi:hypothetical protein
VLSSGHVLSISCLLRSSDGRYGIFTHAHDFNAYIRFFYSYHSDFPTIFLTRFSIEPFAFIEDKIVKCMKVALRFGVNFHLSCTRDLTELATQCAMHVRPM